jgi:hypothetical protein
MIRLHLPPQLRTQVQVADLLRFGSELLELVVVIFVLAVLATFPRANTQADRSTDPSTWLGPLVVVLTVTWASL